MNKMIYRIVLFTAIIAVVSGCKKEDPFSKDYDINLPVATITSISDEKPFVGDTITLQGENLTTTQSVAIGVYTFKILEKQDNFLKVEVPRVIEGGTITLTNAYKRISVSVQSLQPQFYPAIVSTWPAEIQRGKAFIIKGENLDLIKEVKVNGKLSSIVGSATSNQASYATAGIELGETAFIEVIPKTGEKQTSPELPVIAPINTYLPQQTIMLWDFETLPATTEGWGGSPYTATNGPGFFGKEYKISSPAGNGWNGCYIRLTNNNGGQGFDLSAFTSPHITFLVNTYGKKGYANPAITIGGSESDKHFTGQGGQYSDNYMISTQGWEWRSYDLEAMGWPDIKGKLDKIDIWFRGGNVGDTEPFEIALDQVMITDGPLTPTLSWDCESAHGSAWSIATTGSAGLQGYNQGSGYAHITGVSDGWNTKLGQAAWTVPALNMSDYSNGIWINFLLNTGDKEGYFQFDFGQGWMHFMKSQGYGDDYKFVPTQNQWVWRSIKILPGQGDLTNFDPSQEFTMGIQLYGGNLANGTAMEVNADYFIFTTVPLDPNLKPE
jgi:hypothetical protein